MSSRKLFLEERRKEILGRVRVDGRVSVGELSQLFGVSEATVRSDLQVLTSQGLVVRTHGGAVPASVDFQDLALSRRMEKQIQEKDNIGAFGASLVHDGDAIFLDSSSTALAIAQHLKEHRLITVITNGLTIAQELLDAGSVNVIMPGGMLQKDTVTLVGSGGLSFLRDFNIQMGFFGAHGITIAEGLTDINADIANSKKPLVAMCQQVIAVVDSTKWGRVGFAPFPRLEDIHCVISDEQAPTQMVEAMRGMGKEVILI